MRQRVYNPRVLAFLDSEGSACMDMRLETTSHQLPSGIAVVPTGDEWGTQLVLSLNASVTDKLLYGDRPPFESDATAWQLTNVGSEACFNGWISETFMAHHLQARRISVVKVPVAYCKIDDRGSCRYVGQLAETLKQRPQVMHE